jgi:hypothetical protein
MFRKAAFILTLAILPALSFSQTQKKATQAQTPVQQKAEFKFESEEFRFGSIAQGEKVSHAFTFTNIGKEPLILENVSASCGCTVPDWPKEPIKGGEKATINVTFNSAGKSGLQNSVVTIHANTESSPKQIFMKGNVEAPPTENK